MTLSRLAYPDDNKFVDRAIAAQAKFRVSEDRHFRILQEVDFPKIEMIGRKDFYQKIFG